MTADLSIKKARFRGPGAAHLCCYRSPAGSLRDDPWLRRVGWQSTRAAILK